jgi:ribosomal small subunit protein bTHX
MGRGDKRSRRGKIFAGSFGKTRLKNKKRMGGGIRTADDKPIKTSAAQEEKKPKKAAVKKIEKAEAAVTETVETPAVETPTVEAPIEPVTEDKTTEVSGDPIEEVVFEANTVPTTESDEIAAPEETPAEVVEKDAEAEKPAQAEEAAEAAPETVPAEAAEGEEKAE